METDAKTLDLRSLRDGNLHLVAFLGDTFCYTVENPNGSEWAISDALAYKFPHLVYQMLKDAKNLAPIDRRD